MPRLPDDAANAAKVSGQGNWRCGICRENILESQDAEWYLSFGRCHVTCIDIEENHV